MRATPYGLGAMTPSVDDGAQSCVQYLVTGKIDGMIDVSDTRGRHACLATIKKHWQVSACRRDDVTRLLTKAGRCKLNAVYP